MNTILLSRSPELYKQLKIYRVNDEMRVRNLNNSISLFMALFLFNPVNKVNSCSICFSSKFTVIVKCYWRRYLLHFLIYKLKNTCFNWQMYFDIICSAIYSSSRVPLIILLVVYIVPLNVHFVFNQLCTHIHLFVTGKMHYAYFFISLFSLSYTSRIVSVYSLPIGNSEKEKSTYQL